MGKFLRSSIVRFANASKGVALPLSLFLSLLHEKRGASVTRTRVHARPRYEASLRAISNGLHRPSANVKFDVHDYCGPPGRRSANTRHWRLEERERKEREGGTTLIL